MSLICLQLNLIFPGFGGEREMRSKLTVLVLLTTQGFPVDPKGFQELKMSPNISH